MSNYFLYADGDAGECDALRSMLQVHQVPGELRCVPNGFLLIQYLEQVSLNAAYPALIILNFRLPGLSILDTLTLLKTDDFYRLIPVVIFSAAISDEDEKACKALGADVFVRPTEFENWQNTMNCLNSYVDE